jgi:hypothetical protein
MGEVVRVFLIHQEAIRYMEDMQDTVTATGRQDTVRLKTYSQQQALEILMQGERRLRQADSLQRIDSLSASQEPGQELAHLPEIDSSQYLLFDSIPGPLAQQFVFPGMYRMDGRFKSLRYQPSDSTASRSAYVPEKPLVEKTIRVQETGGFHFDWVLIVLVVALFLLAWVQLFYNRLFRPLIISVVNYQESFKLFRDRSALFEKFCFLLNLIFLINLGLFVFFTLQYFHVDLPVKNPILAFLAITAGVFLLYIARETVCRLTGYFALSQTIFSEYTHNIFLINKNAGLALFPLVIGIPYLPEVFVPVLIYIGFTILIAGYLLRLFRGIQIFIKNGFPIFYLILYLCALEFLPISVAIKYLQTVS